MKITKRQLRRLISNVMLEGFGEFGPSSRELGRRDAEELSRSKGWDIHPIDRPVIRQSDLMVSFGDSEDVKRGKRAISTALERGNS